MELSQFWPAIETFLGPIASAIAGAIVARWGTSLPHRRLWGLGGGGTVVFALATSAIEETDDYFRAMTGTGQVRALARLTPSIESGYGKRVERMVFLSEELKMRQELVENHLVVLGGAKNNSWTKECIDHLYERTGFRYIEDGNTMEFDGKIFNSKAEREAQRLDQENLAAKRKAQTNPKGFEKKIDRDYCVLISAVNHFNKIDASKRLFVFAGAHTYGVDGSAQLFTRHIIRRWFRPREFIALAEVQVTMGGIYNMRILKMKKLAKPKKEA